MELGRLLRSGWSQDWFIRMSTRRRIVRMKRIKKKTAIMKKRMGRRTRRMKRRMRTRNWKMMGRET